MKQRNYFVHEGCMQGNNTKMWRLLSLEPMTFDVLLYTCNTYIHLGGECGTGRGEGGTPWNFDAGTTLSPPNLDHSLSHCKNHNFL